MSFDGHTLHGILSVKFSAKAGICSFENDIKLGYTFESGREICNFASMNYFLFEF